MALEKHDHQLTTNQLVLRPELTWIVGRRDNSDWKKEHGDETWDTELSLVPACWGLWAKMRADESSTTAKGLDTSKGPLEM